MVNLKLQIFVHYYSLITCMIKIGIFCAASEEIDASYFDCATEVGHWIGENGNTLVYGGADLGLMECIAKAVKESGGGILAIVPDKLEERGRVSTLPDEIINTRTLSDRKDELVAHSDYLIALPGGVGTLDEIFHVVAAASIGYHQKKVILFNIDGFYDTLIKAIEEMSDKGFIRHSLSTYFDVVDSLEQLKEIIRI